MSLTGLQIEQLRDEDQVVLSGKALKDLYQLGRTTIAGPTRFHYHTGSQLIRIAGSAYQTPDFKELIENIKRGSDGHQSTDR